MGKNVHVVKRGGNWGVVTADSEKAVKITNTQKEAIDIGKSKAQNQKSDLSYTVPMVRLEKRIVKVPIIIYQKDRRKNE